ncbi:hypothetical protein LUZ63_012959 [Rhynchospora breviuscula]|uniref:F-box domain-containing protein n=1 Tax=Rhynchospora breviuscula TaxID=2022672 RepID=A0A9Q0C7Y1_9POAL|nr:hypothetical protein LUZ63_012959 [Rhynchospora breviuscula]
MNRRIDRISSLPDDVLTLILSFLRTRDAVRTCVLSKRWKNIWASPSVLNFDFEYFKPDDVQKFDQFVIGVLKNRGPSDLDTLIYRGRFICKPSMRWLPKAVRLMPRVIIFNITVVDKFRFPDSVFSCASLENLELTYCSYGRSIIRPKSVALSSLKTLKLGFIRLEENLMQKLFLGCPALENLKLFECELYITEISSDVLKELTLDDCWQYRLHVQISCPGLVSMFIRTSMVSIRTILLENTVSLENACISLYGCDQKVDGNVLNSKFLTGLSNTTKLELYFCHLPECKEQLVKDISNCGIFNNLKSLKIGAWNMVNDFSLVACFLEHSPLLEQLTLRLDRWRDIIQEMLGQDVSLEFEELMRVKEVCDKKDKLRRGVLQEMPRQDVSFHIDCLDTVYISCKKKDRLASKMISVLGQQVKTIRNINIREY